MLNIKKLFNSNRRWAYISFVAIVLPIFGSLLSLYIIIEFPEVSVWIKSHPVLFFLGTAFTMAVLLTPTTFVASLSGFMFGLSSVFYVVPAYVIASLLGYFVGQRLDGGKLLRSMVEIDDKQVFRNTVDSNPFWFVMLCRLSPVLPFGFMNIALPAFGVKIKDFIAAGTIGMLPRSVLFIWLGSAAQNLMEALKGGDETGLKFYLTSFLVIFSSLGLLFLFKKKIKELN